MKDLTGEDRHHASCQGLVILPIVVILPVLESMLAACMDCEAMLGCRLASQICLPRSRQSCGLKSGRTRKLQGAVKQGLHCTDFLAWHAPVDLHLHYRRGCASSLKGLATVPISLGKSSFLMPLRIESCRKPQPASHHNNKLDVCREDAVRCTTRTSKVQKPKSRNGERHCTAVNVS